MAKDTILVPVDFTPHSFAALEEASKLATAFDLSIKILHVLHGPAENPGFYADYDDTPKPIDEVALHMFKDFKETFMNEHKEYADLIENSEFELISGTPQHRILEIAESEQPAYIVMGHQGLSAVRKFLIGSITEKVAAKSPVPVVLVKTEDKN